MWKIEEIFERGMRRTVRVRGMILKSKANSLGIT